MMDISEKLLSSQRRENQNVYSLEEISLIFIVKHFIEKAKNFNESDDENL